MDTENTAKKKIMHAVVKNDRGDKFIDDGYESFEYAVDGLINQWRMLTVQKRAEIAKRDYRDITGADYMAAVGYYDDDLSDFWAYISLAEVILLEEYYEENKEMNKECEEESYRTIRTTWPAECSGCLYRSREYDYEIGDYVECIHPLFSRKSYQCPVRMTAMAKKKFGRTALDDYI